MNSAPTPDAGLVRPPPRQWLRWVVVVAVAGGVACAGWFAWQAWFAEKPRLPTVDLSGAHEDVASAIQEAEAGVRAAPRSADAWGQLGMVLLAHDYYPEASDCFVEAEKREPKSGRWLYLDAQACFKIYPLRAITLLEKAVEKDADDAMYRMLLGELLLEQGRLGDAERHLQKAARNERVRPWSQVRQAQIALRRGQTSQAQELAKSAQIKLDDAKVLHVVLSEIHFRAGDFDAAEKARQKSLTLPPGKYPDPHMEAVDRLKVASLPRVAQAHEDIAALQAVVRSHPESGPARLSLAMALKKHQQWQAAAMVADEALKINPNDAIALNVKGYALLRQGFLEDALAAYKRSVEVNPHNAVSYYELANCHERLHNKEAEMESLKTALRLRPNFAEAWRELGRLQVKNNDPEGLTSLRRAVELAPSDPVARKLLDDATKVFGKSPSPKAK